MERKIGEIFEYNGEWYQCVENDKESCEDCDFTEYCESYSGNCDSTSREDGRSICFKKLEKVGEPFRSGGRIYQHYKVFDIDNIDFDNEEVSMNVHNYNKKTVTIEIKQNEEDMEEKHDLKRLLEAYENNEIPYSEYERRVEKWYEDKFKNTATKESKPTLKKFDLEAAKAGKPVCTRDRRKARIVCFDRNYRNDENEDFPIVALVTMCDGSEEIGYYNNRGELLYNCLTNSADLMMLPEKHEGWVNIYQKEQNRFPKGIFPSKDKAIEAISEIGRKYIDTVKIEWNE